MISILFYIIIGLIPVIAVTLIIIEISKILSVNGGATFPKKIDVNHVNENSFQRFAKFYDEVYPYEKDFDAKLNHIYVLISKNGERDIKKICELVSCSVTECVLKIKYLKNKRLIDDLYIDTNNLKLIPCSAEDQALIDKYKPYVYGSHTQVEDFYNLVDWPAGLSPEEQKKHVFEEIKYLVEKELINGVKVDDIDGKIIYYSLEKRKTVYNRETVHCPNCGALNDVEITEKTRCDYCKGIVKGSAFDEVNKES